MRKFLAAMMVSTALSGCATMISGPNDIIGVSSQPPAAKCVLYRDNAVIGSVESTPGAATVSRSHEPIDVTCGKDGYESATQTLTAGTNWWIALDALFLSLAVIPLSIDMASGAYVNYDEETSVKLHLVQPQIPAAEKSESSKEPEANGDNDDHI